ncbi:MAG: phosphate-starvation-inducible PsiE family protein [Methanotrichaceae archaeon]|nr:phosphate-starvation-inducible PsiE family protein [Methanotrichaceae archaeon]
MNQSSKDIYHQKSISYLERFQRFIVTVLIILMALVVLLSILELIYIIIIDIISEPILLPDISELLTIFGYFLLILIGVELLETFKIYLKEQSINVQVVFLVAMIAIARKVIILEPDQTPSVTLIGIGVIIIALASGYYLVKKSQDDPSCRKL